MNIEKTLFIPDQPKDAGDQFIYLKSVKTQLKVLSEGVGKLLHG